MKKLSLILAVILGLTFTTASFAAPSGKTVKTVTQDEKKSDKKECTDKKECKDKCTDKKDKCDTKKSSKKDACCDKDKKSK